MHVLTDLFGSVGAVAAGLIVLTAGFDRADPIAALLVSALMVRSGWTLLRESGRVLLEAAPRGYDVQAIGRALAEQPGVAEVHDLHVWEVTSGFPALAAHVMVPSGADCHGKRRELQELLRTRFGIDHTTLQVEHEPQSRLMRIDDGPTE
jgi:cobalt-zinc-cadmium efflux system protein